MYLGKSGRNDTFGPKAYPNGTKVPIETVVKLSRDDKPRGIVVNPCHS